MILTQTLTCIYPQCIIIKMMMMNSNNSLVNSHKINNQKIYIRKFNQIKIKRIKMKMDYQTLKIHYKMLK